MHSGKSIPSDLRALADRELAADESIHWMDMPFPRFFTSFSTPSFLFGIPWTAFIILITCQAVDFLTPAFTKADDYHVLVLIPFILIGILLVTSPCRSYRYALRTLYVITDRRAIIFDGGWSTTTIRSFPPEKLINLFRRERKNGTGDVILARQPPRDSYGQMRPEELGFFSISNPKEVEAMLTQLAKQ